MRNIFPWNKVIISVPYHSEKQITSEVEQVLQTWKNIRNIEIRFDYWKGQFLDDPVARIAHYLRKCHMNSIFTYQPNPQDEATTLISIYRLLIRHNPNYIDLDTNLQASILEELAELAIQKQTSIIYSYHNWRDTPPKEDISALCEYYLQMLPYFTSNGQNVLKLVFTAKKSTDSEAVLDFCKQYAKKGINLISFCMGELGKESRILSLFYGCAFTYAYMEESTAPGQIHISEISHYL